MPARATKAATTAAEIDGALPRTFYVKRGDIARAFGFTDEEMTALVPAVFAPVYLAPNPRPKKREKTTNARKTYARFVRSAVLGVARRWERKGGAGAQ